MSLCLPPLVDGSAFGRSSHCAANWSIPKGWSSSSPPWASKAYAPARSRG